MPETNLTLSADLALGLAGGGRGGANVAIGLVSETSPRSVPGEGFRGEVKTAATIGRTLLSPFEH